MTDTLLGFASFAIVAASIAVWVPAIYRVAIPSNRVFFVAAWVTAAALGVTALLGSPGWIGGVPASLGVFASMFLLATVAIGGQKVGERAIQVGATMPHFSATDEQGQIFDSEDLVGHPVLIKFFRAHW